MKKQEILNKLETIGVDKAQLSTLSKDELEALLEQSLALETAASETIENITTEIVTETPVEIKIPIPSDPEWTDYVLSLLVQDKEMDNGNPRTDGLRRIASKIFGEFSIITKVVDAPNINNSYRASVIVTLMLKNGIQYDGAADVFSGNTDRKFAAHALATAETRAEGRALRKALKLTKVLSAEEMQGADIDEPTGLEATSAMPTTMLASLEVVANKIGVDLLRTAQLNDISVASTKELTQDHGKKLMTILGQYNRKEKEIPDEIRK